MAFDDYESVIGLEVHAQLLTKSKLFCSDATNFDASANSNVSPISAGHPGTLPVLNKRAVEFAIRAAIAVSCKVNLRSVFARKNYFYPDLPKGYQITQYDQPYSQHGYLDIEIGGTPQKPEITQKKRIGITRIHMEEDAGKSVHGQGYSLVNLNRAGMPLIEIVSEPDMRTAEEAGAYLRKLRAVLMYIDVCDGNMQEGSLRCDANVSVRKKGDQKFGTRCEIKNVNSFRFVEKAIEFEIKRQIQVIESGGKIIQETRTYDSGKNITLSLRGKEDAHDYRYFPDPDLPALVLVAEQVEQIRKNMQELPDQKKERYVNEFGIPAYDASVITSSKKLAEFFDQTVKVCGEPKMVSNWVMGEMLRLLKAADLDIEDFNLRPEDLGGLVKLIKAGTISNNIGKTVFEEMFKTQKSPDVIVKEKGLVQISDTGAIEKVVDEIIAANPTQLADYRSGKDKLFGFFVGQVMKKMAGKGNPNTINEILKNKLNSLKEK